MTQNWGEMQAEAYLKEKGLHIIVRNYQTRYGEIDMIAQTDAYIIFVEVKMRKGKRFAHARESVTQSKQNKILLTAQAYLQESGERRQPRFDVVEVYGSKEANRVDEICWLENAFGG